MPRISPISSANSTGKPPACQNSHRSIGLTKSAMTTLQAAHLSRQLEEIKLMDSLYKPGGLLLATQADTTQPLQIERAFVKRAELRQVRFYDLHHTCAAVCYSARTSTPSSSRRCWDTPLLSASPGHLLVFLHVQCTSVGCCMVAAQNYAN